MDPITSILNQVASQGDFLPEELFSALYDDLRLIAANKLRREHAGHTLPSTALVHEAFIKLMALDDCNWENRYHFFVTASEIMRQILIDHARTRKRLKRGGDWNRVDLSFDRMVDNQAVQPIDPIISAEELLRLEEALIRLESLSAAKAKLVKLRFFGGLTVTQAADVLGVSRATAERYWAFARAWLHRQISQGDDASKYPESNE